MIEELHTRKKQVFGRLNAVCLSCEKLGCCAKCFSNMFQEFLIKYRNDEKQLPFILNLVEEQLEKYEKTIK